MGCASPSSLPPPLPFYSPSEDKKVGHGAQHVPKKQVVDLEAQG